MTYSNIAIIKLSSLGDIIHTLPAFNLLRKKFPDARISWIAEPAGAKLLENFSGIDEIIVIHLKTPTLLNKFKEVRRIISTFRKKFDLVFDFQGLLKSGVLSYLLRSYTIGFDKKNLRESPASLFYWKRADFFDESSHVMYKNIHLVRSVLNGIAPAAGAVPAIEYPPLKEIPRSESLTNFLSSGHLETKKFIILNVGGGWQTKLLDNSQYITIVNELRQRQKKGNQIVILWGNEREKKTAQKISRETGAIMTDFMSFSDLIRFIKRSRFIITADTLPLHIADMVGTPSLGIFGPTSPHRNGSLLEESSAIYEKLPCNFCYKKKCGKMECLKNLNIKNIIHTIEKIDEKCG